TLDFNGATIFATTDGSTATPPDALKYKWPRSRAQLYITKSKNMVVRGLVARGANQAGGVSDAAWQPQYEAQHAVDLEAVAGALVENSDLSFLYGDGVYIGN